MEMTAVKRDFRVFSQHLEQLLKSDDSQMNKDANVDDDDEKERIPKEKSPPYDAITSAHSEQEPRDLRTQKCLLRKSAYFHEEKGNKTDEREDLDIQKFSHEPGHDDVGGCSACDLLRSLDYLRRNRLLCDVIFQVQSNAFYAHQAVMASCSEVYREKYLEEIRNNRQKQLDVFQINEVTPKIFQKLLDFIYTGRIEFDDTEVYSLIDAASLLKIKAITNKCFQYIKSRKNFSSDHIFQKLQKLGENGEDVTNGVFPRKLNSVAHDSEKTDQAQNLPRRASGYVVTDSDTNNISNASAKRSRYYSCNPPSMSSQISNERSLSTSDDISWTSPINGEFLHQSHLKKNEYIARRNQPIANKTSNQQFQHSSTNFSPEQRENADAIQSLRNSPVKSYSSERQVSMENNRSFLKNAVFKPTQADQHMMNGSCISDWFSSSLLNERIRTFHQTQFPAQQEKHNENVWSNFFRNRMLAKDCNFLLRYGSVPFYSNPFSFVGQHPSEKKLVGTSNQSAMAAPKMDLSSKRIHHTPHQINRTTDVDQVASAPSNADHAKEQRNEIQTPSTQTKPHSKRDDALKPYDCPLCDAQFNRPANLKTHMRIHSGEKPYKCETCGARFVQVAHLRAHVLIHTGEKPYPCNVCGTSFRHLQTLKSHLRIHTGEKPYSCEKCRVQFRHKSQLRLHLRTKHGVQTNTKKTYKQVSGLRSADISAHIKRAQEAAKFNCSERAMLSPTFSRGVMESRSMGKSDAAIKMSSPFSPKQDVGHFSMETVNDEIQQQNYKAKVQAHFAKLDTNENNENLAESLNPDKALNANGV